MINKTQIAVGSPTMGNIRVDLATWIQSNGLAFTATVGISPHSFARNKLVELFLESKYEYLLMIDSDTVPQGHALRHIMEFAEEDRVMTGVTAIIKGDRTCPNVYKKSSDVEGCVSIADETEPFKVEGCGASFMLIPRKILESMPKPWFKSIEYDDSKICSEDLYFCDQVHKLGYQIWCHPEAKCLHYKTIGLPV